MIRALCVAAPVSSAGKTTVTLALAAALRARGLRVRCAKVGPDFIDPGFHAWVTGLPSATLDAFFLEGPGLRRAFARAGWGADLVLVEGMMGLFDGLDGAGRASTAEVARQLGVPVVLVVDAGATARSAAAQVLGVRAFEPDLGLAGVIWNRVGGERHAGWLSGALAARVPVPVLGSLPWDEGLALPERHLGLVTAREGVRPDLLERLAAVGERALDLDGCLALARSDVAAEPPPSPAPPRVRLGLASDEAFQFYYPETLAALRAAGAELVPWSPLRDPELPEVDGLYLGGGYPEVHAARLAANAAGRQAVARAVREGRPVYAECGGLMYLARTLEDLDGRLHPMVGVLPATVRLTPRRLALGYREVELLTDGLLGERGTRLRGHEFHRSFLPEAPACEAVYRVRDPVTGQSWSEGWRVGPGLASYVHLFLDPPAASALVEALARARAGAAP